MIRHLPNAGTREGVGPQFDPGAPVKDRGGEISVLERLFSLLETGSGRAATRTSRIAVDVYLSAQRLALEKTEVFRKLPIVVGPAAALCRPGDFITHDAAGVPLLVARDREGGLGAFLNVCRHRGAKLVESPSGSAASAFVCRYHGWSYDTAGRLKGVRHAAGFPDLDRATRCLIRLPVTELHGMVFVRLQPGPDIHLAECLDPLFYEIDSLELSERSTFGESVRTVRANWKLVAETMLESYHVATLHRRTGGTAFEDNTVLFDQARWPHGRFVLPLKGASRPPIDELDEWKLLYHAALVYWMFPNSFVFAMGPFAHLLTIFPLDEQSCLVKSWALIHPRSNDEAGRSGFKSIQDSYWATIVEDIEAVEGVQACLPSGANGEFVAGWFERYVPDLLHTALDEVIAGTLRF